MTGWQEQKLHRAILDKYHRICHVCGKPGADTVDDVIPLAEGGQPTAANKRPIHAEPCHRVKTVAEAAAARAATPGRRRPADPHPGLQ